MEEFLLHHCVTSEVAKSADNEKPQASTSVWQTSGRAECVLVQENRQAHGSSRVILSAMLKLESPQVAQGVDTSAKLTHVDYSDAATNFHSSTSSKFQLLGKLVQDIGSVEAKVELKGVTSARPLVVVLDSLNALLQQTSLQQVLLFFRRLREHALVGSVIARLNAGAESPAAAQALAAQATALVLVETRSSLRSYRFLPRNEDNGRSSESLEYFQMLPDKVQFVAAADVDSHSASVEKTEDVRTTAAPMGTRKSEFKRKSQSEAKPSLSRVQFALQSNEPRAKSNCRTCTKALAGLAVGPVETMLTVKVATLLVLLATHLFFIDEDDPDWDDDDLDDDLDI
ncbi:hypothetical protein GQ600_25616 [Phytophthora cactorum]|nr:hypothetical protein GQ600_25616 [Phytophthora cactorum]